MQSIQAVSQNILGSEPSRTAPIQAPSEDGVSFQGIVYREASAKQDDKSVEQGSAESKAAVGEESDVNSADAVSTDKAPMVKDTSRHIDHADVPEEASVTAQSGRPQKQDATGPRQNLTTKTVSASPISAMVQGLSQGRALSDTSRIASPDASANASATTSSGPTTISTDLTGPREGPETPKSKTRLDATALSMNSTRPGLGAKVAQNTETLGSVTPNPSSGPVIDPMLQGGRPTSNATDLQPLVGNDGRSAINNALAQATKPTRTTRDPLSSAADNIRPSSERLDPRSPIELVRDSARATVATQMSAQQPAHPAAAFQAAPSVALRAASQQISGFDTMPIIEEFAWDVRPSLTNQSSHILSNVARAELPQHVSQAIAKVFQRAPDKPVEIALNPVELGRVRLVMATHETGVTVTVTAERGETLDLMRRNIDDLGKSLNDLGFEDVSFEFEQHQHQPETDDTGDTSAPAHETSTEDDILPQQLTRTPVASVSPSPATGIDMRL